MLKLPRPKSATTMVWPGSICRWDGSQSWCHIVAGGSSYIVLIQLCSSLHVNLSPRKTIWWSRSSSRSAINSLYFLPSFTGHFLGPTADVLFTWLALHRNLHSPSKQSTFILCRNCWAVGHALTVSTMGWCKGMGYDPRSFPEEIAGGNYNCLRVSYRYCCPVGPWDLQQQLFAPRSNFARKARSLFPLHSYRAAWPGPTTWSKQDLGLSLWTLLGAR